MEKVSIIIPFYNCPYIGTAIESALNQTYANCEVIVVDDGSEVEYSRLVTPYLPRIKYIRKKNGGTATALNEGIRHMTGDYFAWLSSDDLFLPNKTQLQLEFMKTYHYAFSFSSFQYMNDRGEVTTAPIPMPTAMTELSLLKMMREYCPINGCTVMMRRDVFDRIGWFDESLRYTQDYEMWTRVLMIFSAGYVQKSLVYYRMHENMGTVKYKDAIHGEVNEIHRRHSAWIQEKINRLTTQEASRIHSSQPTHTPRKKLQIKRSYPIKRKRK
ncbi:glycosyltransferase family 2 protein [Pontibacillus salicampi]